jgi:cytochrome P460
MARVAVLLALVFGLAACGGSDEPAAEPEPAPTETADTGTETAPPEPTTSEETTTEEATTTEARPEPLPGLPRFTAGYTEWAKLATDIPPRDSDPHLGTKDVFTSRELSGDRFPVGTVIVKHATRPGKNFIGLVATMRKIKGADPEHNDWVFVEWTRESRDEVFVETASGAVCWSCHVGADQADYVWVLTDDF